MKVRNLIAVLGLSLAAPFSVSAEEGMWLPSQINQMGPELAALGIRISPAELADLNGYPLGALAQIWGCTASFVSPDGLLLTNSHCASSALQFNSSPERDLATDGFLASSREEELWSGAGSRIYVTSAIDDVTQKMMAGLDSKLSNEEYYAIIDRREKEIVRNCEQGGGARCRVVPLFDGLQYLSVRQNEIRDIRLVYAPSLHVGSFGGDEDNFMWPRHAGDFAFFRAYVGKNGLAADYNRENVPYRPKRVVRFSTEGLNPGDPVVVPGYPAKTLRYKPAVDVKRVASVYYPQAARFMRDYLQILRTLGAENEETRIRLAPTVFNYENALKATEGSAASISRSGLVKRRETEEQELTEFLRRRKDRRESDVVEQLAQLSEESWQTERRDTVLGWMMRVSPLLNQSLQIYRFSLERPKKDADRQWGFQERDIPRLTDLIERSQKSLPVEADRAGLEHFLREASALPAGERIEAIDAALKATGEADTSRAISKFLDSLYGRTGMTELSERKAMLRQSTAELDERADPFLQLAAAFLPGMIEKERVGQARYAAASRLRPRYMEGLMALRGGRLSPDANSTLRVSLGRVKGYSPRDGVTYGAQTTLDGLVAKNRNVAPFYVSPELLAAAGKAKESRWIDPELGTVPVNFLSTADLTAGNSGSPTFNADGEVVGILFDGNYESMASDYAYDPRLTRSIHVDVRYMFWVMETVDGASALMREMGIPER